MAPGTGQLPPLDAKHAVIVIGVQGGGLDLRPSEANAT